MMTAGIKWAMGMGPKPATVTFLDEPVVFEKVYPAHVNGNEVDPSEHQCQCCGTVTDLICERCEAITCDNCFGMEKFGGPYGDGPSGLNYCKSCMDSHDSGSNDYDF